MKQKEFINICNEKECILFVDHVRFCTIKEVKACTGMLSDFICITPREGGFSRYLIRKCTIKSVFSTYAGGRLVDLRYNGRNYTPFTVYFE